MEFATILNKFDQVHPEFTKTESRIMNNIINRHMNPQQALQEAQSKRDGLSNELEYVFEGKDSSWKPPGAK